VTEKKKKDDPYSQAVASGRYVRETGLQGKYDNVRVFWEDEVTRIFLRPHVEALLERRTKEKKGIRILDLGCGSGDGYELLTRMRQGKANLTKNEIYLIPENRLTQYKGIEINEDLLNQNAARWGENSGMVFEWGDFSKGLPVMEGELPYDIYLTSYGAISHLNEAQTVKLFADIVKHAEDGSILIGDWLGRYSYEWRQLWNGETDKEHWMDYFISYIYPENQREKARLTPLKLRLLCREEVLRMIKKVEEETGINLEVKNIYDRSIFVGRHMDTGDYNSYLKPLRRAVNSLFERNLRTDLHQLLLAYHSHPEFSSPNKFFEEFHACWNFLVYHTIALCKGYDRGDHAVDIPSHQELPLLGALERALHHITQVTRNIGNFSLEDSRADVIEPQLAYALRELEISLQQGKGYGHGIVGIFVINK